MNQSLLITPRRRDSNPLAFDKPTLLTLVVASLLLTETFSGALRYYFDMLGISWLLYLPKVACLAALCLELLRYRGWPLFWLALLGLLTSSQLALMHGAELRNIGFSLFIYIPLLFGLICGRHLELRLSLLRRIIGFCLIASFAGIALDLLTNVPWKGYSYMVGEVELSANRSWAFDDIDRIGGFARMSTALSVMIAIYSLFIAAFIRSRLLRLVLYAAALVGIVLTTNKSTAAAYALTLLMLVVTAYRFASASAFLIAVLTGLALPIASLLLSLDPNAANNGTLLASFADRLINSWPNFIAVITGEGWGWWGAGFGVVGSAGQIYRVPGLELLSIADNTALYLWGMLGVFGVLLYLLLFPLLLRLQERGPRLRNALLPIVFCLCLVAWATDVLEVTTATLFLGLAISHVLTPARAPTGILAAQRLPELQRLI
ncbi:hypothetical protein CXK94_10195 [Stutzerimonas stutzeri]|uniref:O-antigen ligase domain-containing protein n=1 Tax=Stutzerimonas stutzeri TaxID=316 RepID=A0A2N8T573_STUST|nr:hypothetical protein [Stutzerimonas stutzeri]MCQ4325200.1 hypothetical protein [Stutzerimonas stutzeri]PNG09901.1 hypothetical protein CXK94_10195 [Stutzerimonas stutzeri]